MSGKQPVRLSTTEFSYESFLVYRLRGPARWLPKIEGGG